MRKEERETNGCRECSQGTTCGEFISAAEVWAGDHGKPVRELRGEHTPSLRISSQWEADRQEKEGWGETESKPDRSAGTNCLHSLQRKTQSEVNSKWI